METTLGYIREESIVQKIVSSKLFWFFAMLIIFSYPIYRSMNRVLPPDLPRYFKVPEFNLTNEFNKPFGTNDLKGKTYLASFAFTSCPSSCPGLMKNLQKVQKRIRGLGTKVAILTFTVDPETDTPKVLHKYARGYQANPFVWSFLTGTNKELHSLLVKGFKVPVGELEETKKVFNGEDVTLYDIAHSEKIVLVDWEGMIRGYYSTDNDNINKLMIDLGLLINRQFN